MNAGSGTIILLHGALGSRDDLSALAAKLRTLDYEPVAFNFSGHGRTGFAEHFGIRQFATELGSFIGSERPHLFGYSMGGYVALELATRKGADIGKVVTLATKLAWTPELAEKEARGLQPDRLNEKAPAFVKSLEQKHGEAWRTLLGRTGEMMKELAADDLFPERLTSIENEVMLGVGDRDHLVTMDETASAYRSLKRGAYYVLPKTRHPFESADTGLLASLIDRFIRE